MSFADSVKYTGFFQAPFDQQQAPTPADFSLCNYLTLILPVSSLKSNKYLLIDDPYKEQIWKIK